MPLTSFDSARARTGEWVSPLNTTSENCTYVIAGLHTAEAAGGKWKPSLPKTVDEDRKFAKLGFNENGEGEEDKYPFNNSVLKVYVEKPAQSIEVSSVVGLPSD